ncbi:site-specific DNA-methyltransferase [Sphingomonas montana]|uniref:site-specific DNA-methyltransferase n=1 Tax=Sphingomonas montana TaxID=1843236 RepID=UPI0019D1D019|nr:DNA methyltransferase [Sphingomonas montana]
MNIDAKTLETRRVQDLIPYAGNARTHSAKQVRQISDSIAKFGFLNPIIVDADGRLLAGHARLSAAKLLGREHVPTIRLDHMSQAEKRAYVLTDNRLAEASGWSKTQLATELALIIAEDPDFNIELTGFDLGTVELLLDQDAVSGLKDEEPVDVPAGPAVSRVGDLGQLGPHRLYCGDATLRASYLALMGRARAQMIFCDPPYNVPVQGHVSGLGKNQHREFVQGSGELSEAGFIAFLTAAMTHMAAFSIDGSVHFHCMDWRHHHEIGTAGRAVYDGLLNICVYAKPNGGMGSLYRSQHELVFVFKRGTRSHINAVELGRHGRNRTNLWSYDGASSFSKDRAQHLAWHPTVKPLAMVADAILDVSRRDGAVLDPFGGSGTTLMAAEQTGRRARLMELDPLYCDLIIRRFEAATGQVARDQNGQTLSERAHVSSSVAGTENGGE